MRVKVLKVSKDTYWYANQIGCYFEPVGEQVLDGNEIYKVEVGLASEKKIMPILKYDCEIVKEKDTDSTHTPDWRVRKLKGERERQLRERSGYKTAREIQHYENLNFEQEVKIKNNDEEGGFK